MKDTLAVQPSFGVFCWSIAVEEQIKSTLEVIDPPNLESFTLP